MKIKTIQTKFRPAYVQMYFVVETAYDHKQLKCLLNQLSAIHFGHGSNIQSPLEFKNKLFINPDAQKVYNKKDTYIVHVCGAKTKIQKAVNLMHILDDNGCKVPDCIIVMGGDHEVKAPEKMNKSLKVCKECSALEYKQETEFKTKGGLDLLAHLSAIQGCGSISVSGSTITVKHNGGCVAPGQGYIKRFEKKFKDGLKDDFNALKSVIDMSFGIL